MLVTDVKRILREGEKGEHETTGFYMDGFLKENLDTIPQFLAKEWDCVGIVSGHGKVRIGKSTLASQVCYYIAWVLAGGEVICNEKREVVRIIPPKEEVKFNLQENVVFSADELQQRAIKLYEKYGKGQVILYDEGMQGTDSARAMESINKGMAEFFQECGFMGHVIIIVLSNFFKLHEDYAVARSLFLIDVAHDKNYRRGYFSFYNDRQKELLYYFGKKRIGVSAKYVSANESFWGKFTRWLPFDKDEYEQEKKKAIEKKRITRKQKNFLLQRNFLFWLLFKRYGAKTKDIAKEMEKVIDIKMTPDNINEVIHFTQDIINKKIELGI